MTTHDNRRDYFGTEDIAHEATATSGGYYFSPDTRRFFAARAIEAHRAQDGVLYVYHSSKAGFEDYRREYSVTAFTSDGSFDLLHRVSRAAARRFYESCRRAGIACDDYGRLA